jgi:excisionase family DNA binding protein
MVTKPRVYTVETVQGVLPFKRAKLYQLLRSGELKSVRVGGKRLILEEHIEEFLQSLRERADTQPWLDEP